MHPALQPLYFPRSFFLFLLPIYLLLFSTGFSLLADLSPADFLLLPSTSATFGPNFLLQLLKKTLAEG